MWDEEVLPLALQSHLLQAKHFTTQDGECIPQYLMKEIRTLQPQRQVLTYAQA
jgi:hypothetical protein